ncbi:MAG: 3-deoxy-7-phosphoheptulonate synthase [Nanoarchaeota archaeon]
MNTIPHPEQLESEMPISKEIRQRNQKHVTEIREILAGNNNRLLINIGPCSLWPPEESIEYARKLNELNPKIEDVIKIVMRAYIQKPRTTTGWKGLIYGPYGEEETDMAKGIRMSRELLLEILNQTELPLSDEALSPENGIYFDGLLSYVALGARTSESQTHREHISSLAVPAGIKHPTSGNLQRGIESIIACQAPHDINRNYNHIRTSGNEYAHLILRGGENGPNYALKYLEQAAQKLRESQISNPGIIVDCNHANSGKNYSKQIEIAKYVVDQRLQNPELLIKGLMIESHLEDGKQISVTDPCLGWEKSEKLLLDIAQKLRKRNQ